MYIHKYNYLKFYADKDHDVDRHTRTYIVYIYYILVSIHI